MKAAIYTAYGPPSVLHLTETGKPVPKDNELLVRVHASTVSAAVIWIRNGRFPGSRVFTFFIRLLFGLTKPKRPILGFEFSGVVEAVGKDVKLFRTGDPVYGTTTGLKNGAYADYVCIPEQRSQGVVALKPDKLTFAEAAALPVGGMTALHLLQKAGIRKGQRILVYGASGSVGTYAVQLAKYYGASVTGVCSTANLALVKSIGADDVADYTQTDITRCGLKFDVVFDAVNKLPSARLKPLLKKGGRLVSVKSMTGEKTEYLHFLQKVTEEDKLKPVIDRTYPLEQIVEANAYVELGHKKGNVVITIHTA